MLEQSFGLFFFLKQTKNQNQDGLRYVYLRITVDGLSKELSTKNLWHPDKWNASAGRASGNREDAKTLNHQLEALVIAIHVAKTGLLERGKEISAAAIKEVLLGHSADNRYILALFKEHNDKIKTLIGTGDYAHATYLKYKTSYSHAEAFIKFKYGKPDLTLKQLDYSFIVDFNYWLKSVKKCGPNSVAKYISNFKRIVLDCVRRGWIKSDPFAGFSIEKKEVIKIALNIACLLSCTSASTVDKFYTEKGEWDSARIPFIKPYEAIITSKELGWSMNLDGKDGDTGFSNIKKANVEGGIIFIYSINSIFHGVDVNQSWHIIIPGKRIEKGFASYHEYRDYLNALGIKSEPTLYDIGHIADYYEDHDTVDWKAIK